MKVYQVEFNKYTDATKQSVCDEEGNHYIHLDGEPLLMWEKDVSIFQKYGGGIKQLTHVGNLWESNFGLPPRESYTFDSGGENA